MMHLSKWKLLVRTRLPIRGNVTVLADVDRVMDSVQPCVAFLAAGIKWA